jgi:very-short-patch-repair endonuclease
MNDNKIASQIEDWRRRLLDLTKRNRLINCKIGPTSALELEHPAPDEIWDSLAIREAKLTFVTKSDLVGNLPLLSHASDDGGIDATVDELQDAEPRSIPLKDCLASKRLQSDHLLTELTDAKLNTRLKRLALTAKTSIEEQGVNVLFAAFGLLEWYESEDSEVLHVAPLLLLPVELKRAEISGLWQLGVYENEVTENQCLRELLKANFRFELPAFEKDEEESHADPFEYFDRVTKYLVERPESKRWRVRGDVILGTFSFQKIAMWDDLGKNAERIAGHGICRGIAGDGASVEFGSANLPAPREFDRQIPPSEVHCVLDNDSSQFEAILAAKRGTSLVVDGPPGTGKSQTIANIIAECLAEQKTVLFVSEKAAALEVVKRRLDDQRLGDFCLECHSHKASKKEVLAELGRCLNLPVEQYRDQTAELTRLGDLRRKLNDYVQAIHERRAALQLTPFEAHGQLAALHAVRPSRAGVRDVLATSRQNLEEILASLHSLSRCKSALAEYASHPWRGFLPDSYSLSLTDDVRATLELVARVTDALGGEIELLHAQGLLSDEPTLAELPQRLARIGELLAYPLIPRAWFGPAALDLADSIEQLHNSEERLRSLQTRWPQFGPTIGNVPTESRRAALSFRSDEVLGRLRLDGSISIRSFSKNLARLLEQLAALRHAVVNLRGAIDQFSRALQVRIDVKSSFGVLHKLSSLGSTVAATGSLKLAWFDDTERARLLQVEATVRNDISVANDIAQRHHDIWTAEAYTEEGETIATEARQFESIWQRWWGTFNGRWGAFHRRARRLYVNQPPQSGAELVADLDNLQTYHRRVRCRRGVEEQHRANLVFDNRGESDWGALRRGLDAIDRVQTIIRVPDKLKQVLCTEGMIDRSALRSAASTIERELSQIDQSVNQINEHFSLYRLTERRCAYLDLSSDEFESWLAATEQSLQQFMQCFADVEASLLPDSDAPLAQLADVFQTHDASVAQAEEGALLRQKLASIQDDAGEAITASAALSPQVVETARGLKRLLQKYGAQPPECVVAVSSDATIRRSVAEATASLEGKLREELEPAWERLEKFFPLDQPISDGIRLNQLSLKRMNQWANERLAQLPKLPEWMELRRVERRLENSGLRPILSEVLEGQITSENAPYAFQARFLRDWLDAVYRDDPVLQGFSVDDHEAILQSFQASDQHFIDGAYKRIRQMLLAHPDRPHAGMLNAPPSSELGIIMRESTRKRPRLPLRQLFRKIPSILQRLKPCVMMSPLAVSTYLDSPELLFDVVIFDEASQVRPYDAIGAIYRGKQLLVAGDQQQLPPTSFFDRADSVGDEDLPAEDDRDETQDISEYESILDVCCSLGMPRKRLRWHYRSRRESLIAFSNQFFYGRELITFPSVFDVEGQSAVKLHFVERGRWVSTTSGGYNPIEAKETVALIVRHIEQWPNRSLGVITFNQRQQFAVDDELDKIKKQRPDIAEFFSDARREPFFIKNLENVQGDERDHIILGIAYGPDAQGKFAMRFGPLNQKGGQRRLNVAITRARYQLDVVSSIHADQINLSKTNAEGAKLLRSFLDFAERGVSAIASATSESPTAEHDSEFEAEVERALRERGCDVRRQVGCSGFRIDLALVHPQRVGRYVLGIECDGAAYHSSATARDRDRLRQEVLEGLGWKLCRVWSTDWIRNPSRQIDRVLAAYQEQLLRCDTEASDVSADEAELAEVTEEEPLLKVRNSVDETMRIYSYNSIEDVPDRVIGELLRELLTRYGQTTRDELIKSTARQLGFQRTGRKIQQRLEGSLEIMVGRGEVKWGEDGCVSIA